MNSDAQELVSELEFVWNQIKNNSPSTTTSEASPTTKSRRQFQRPSSGTEGPMKVLSPMSEDDAAEQEYRERQQRHEEELEELENDEDIYLIRANGVALVASRDDKLR